MLWFQVTMQFCLQTRVSPEFEVSHHEPECLLAALPVVHDLFRDGEAFGPTSSAG